MHSRRKSEDLFELLFVKQQRVPQRLKQNKNAMVSVRRYNQRGKFFAFFLTCLRKKVAKTLGFVKIKGSWQRGGTRLFDVFQIISLFLLPHNAFNIVLFITQLIAFHRKKRNRKTTPCKSK
jgi:hypothetical protein